MNVAPRDQDGWLIRRKINIDWAGIAVERASKMRLNDYMIKHIYEPLGLKNISMIPTPEMKKNLALMHVRNQDGTLSTCDNHIMSRALRVSTPEEIAHFVNGGGGGCFAKPQEYARKLHISRLTSWCS